MRNNDKKIDDMDYGELNKLKEELETDIETKEEEIIELKNALEYTIEKINKLDDEED